MRQPNEYMSEFGPTRSPAACSGDMYAAEPIAVIVLVRAVACWSARRAMPKSTSFGVLVSSSDESTTLAGFTSRWTTPRRWAEPSPAATWASSGTAARQSIGPRSVTIDCRLGPWRNSMTM